MYPKLRQFREEKQLTQRQLAKYLNCHHATYSKYERGTLLVPLEVMIQLSFFYNVKVDDLLMEKDTLQKNNE